MFEKHHTKARMKIADHGFCKTNSKVDDVFQRNFQKPTGKKLKIKDQSLKPLSNSL